MKAVFERITDLNFKELTETLKSVCAWGDEETLLLVLNRDAKKLLGVPQYSSGLSQASQKDNRPLVVYWLEKHPERQNIVVDPATLIDVSENGFMDILPMLIQHSRPTDSFKKKLNQCLQAASRNGHEETVQYLVRKGANVNTAVKETRYTSGGDRRLGHKLSHEFYDDNATTRKLSALQAALLGFERFDSKPELGYFQQQCQSAWIAADILSQQRCVEILLARGADPNRANKYNRYPLNIAAAYCTAELVQKLISSGARVRAATKKHGTALEAAARRETGGLPIIKAVLEAQEAVSSIDLRGREAAALSKALSFFEGSDWDSYGDDGRFRLSRSITDVLSTGPGAVVKILLARLSDITTDDPRYGLLFQMACMAGDRECVELLLQRGIDVNRTGNYYGTALQAASRVGNIETVDHLLDSGANVNILGGAHGTALRAAVLGGHEDVVRRLLACGADVNLSDEDNDEDRGDSVLHLALKSRSDAIFKALFVAGAAVSTANSNQRHILITACKQGHAAVVDLLLASGVDVNISETQPEYYRYIPDKAATPLIAACAEGHPSVVRLLLAYGANIEKTNDSSATPLMAAIKGNNLSIVRLLLDAHADVNHAVHYPRRWQSDVHGSSWLSTPSRATAWDTPLSEAAQNGKLEIVEDFLSAGAIIGGPLTQRDSLAAACNNRQHMVVELLLETLSGSQYEAEVCGEALSEIMEGGDPQTICLLLERVASPSFDLLRQACSAGVLEAVEMLVNTGIDVNENDGVDAPLLHVAASHSRPEIVQYLLDRGANVILRSPIYGSPLIAALEGSVALFVRCHSQPESCQSLAKQLPFPEPMHDFYSIRGTKIRQCEQVVQSLFEAGAEMDTTVRTFGSALHLASYLGSQEIVRYLLQGMDDINIFGGCFESPLIAAVTGNHAVIAELLLDRGVNVGRSSPEHGSALRCACAHGSMKLIRSLLDRGADVNADDDENQSALASAVSSYADPTMQGKDTKSSEERRKILEMLLGHEPKVHIRECDLLAAISSDSSNYGNRPDLTSLFLRHDESAVATETVLIEAIRDSTYRLAGFEALESLLKRDGGLGTTPAMLKAVESGEVMRLLLEHQPDCHITADVVLDLIGKGWGRLEILKVLVECRKTVEFTAEIRKALNEKFQSQAVREAASDKESQSEDDQEAASDKESQSEDDQEAASDKESQSEDDQEAASDKESQSEDDQEAASDEESQSEDDQETVSDEESHSEDNQEGASDEESQREDDEEIASVEIFHSEEELFYKLERRPI
jgi:ankyrin repeat protein